MVFYMKKNGRNFQCEDECIGSRCQCATKNQKLKLSLQVRNANIETRKGEIRKDRKRFP